MPNLGGLGFSRIVVLAPGLSSDDWRVQLGMIRAMTSFSGWGDEYSINPFGGSGLSVAAEMELLHEHLQEPFLRSLCLRLLGLRLFLELFLYHRCDFITPFPDDRHA